ALAVDSRTERVDHAADERVPDRDREDPTGALDLVALLDLAGVTEHDRADRVLVEVQRESEHAVLELEHLVHGGTGKAGDARDAVAHFEDAADLGLYERRRERLDMLAQRGCDLVGVDRQLGHREAPRLFRSFGSITAGPSVAQGAAARSRRSRCRRS